MHALHLYALYVSALKLLFLCTMQESEVSEEDYKKLKEARRQHEDELKARRELRAIRRKASQAKAAAEKAATAATPVMSSSGPSRERTRSGGHA
jgi:hypothetical protein